MPDEDEGWPMSAATPQIEINARCRTCDLHIATRVCPDGAAYEHEGYVAAEVAGHTSDGRGHDVIFTVETLEAATARHEREAAEREAADALAHEQMLARMRDRSAGSAASPARIAWPF